MKICILGAESTGKTTLAMQLQKKIGAVLIEEYARSYCEKLDRKPNKEDVYHIARQQIKEFQNYENIQEADVIFDAGLLTSIVWLEDKFNEENELLLKSWEQQIFEFIFLCAPDIEWEYDVLREDEYRRQELHETYKVYLQQTKKPYFVLRGKKNHRLKKALQIITASNQKII